MESSLLVLDRYRLEERIGAGGMGMVWKATDLLLDQPVALKRIMLAGVDDEQAEETRARAAGGPRRGPAAGPPTRRGPPTTCSLRTARCGWCWNTCPPTA